VYVALLAMMLAIDPECQAVIDANSQSIQSLRTIQVSYTIAWTSDREQAICEQLWVRDGQKERVERITNPNGPPLVGENPRTRLEFVINGDSVKFLRNWDPENPARITPTNQAGIRADVLPRTGINPAALVPSAQLLFEVESMPRRTLSELANGSSVTCKERVEVDGHELSLVSLVPHEETTAPYLKREYDVFLDPTAGYMIRKVVVRVKTMLPTKQIRDETHVHEVTEFKDFGDGIFFPMRIRNGTPGSWMTEIVVQEVELNEPVPDDTFEMQWPEFVLVRYNPPVNGVLKFDVWGDGKALASFEGSDDLRGFEAKLREDPIMAAKLGTDPGAVRPAPPLSLMFKLLIAFAVLLGILAAAVVARRVREQSA
jgi:hypothetical protein